MRNAARSRRRWWSVSPGMMACCPGGRPARPTCAPLPPCLASPGSAQQPRRLAVCQCKTPGARGKRHTARWQAEQTHHAKEEQQEREEGEEEEEEEEGEEEEEEEEEKEAEEEEEERRTESPAARGTCREEDESREQYSLALTTRPRARRRRSLARWLATRVAVAGTARTRRAPRGRRPRCPPRSRWSSSRPRLAR